MSNRASVFPTFLLGCVALVFACGDTKSADSAAIAKALAPVLEAPERHKQAGQALARVREAANAKQEEVRRTTIDAAAVLPQAMPTDIKLACEAVVTAYDKFKLDRFRDDTALTAHWTGMREPELKRLTTKCLERNNLKVAACEANALGKAPPTLGDNDLFDLLHRCVEKFEGAADDRVSQGGSAAKPGG
jgi:hypothetical protein